MAGICKIYNYDSTKTPTTKKVAVGSDCFLDDSHKAADGWNASFKENDTYAPATSPASQPAKPSGVYGGSYEGSIRRIYSLLNNNHNFEIWLGDKYQLGDKYKVVYEKGKIVLYEINEDGKLVPSKKSLEAVLIEVFGKDQPPHYLAAVLDRLLELIAAEKKSPKEKISVDLLAMKTEVEWEDPLGVKLAPTAKETLTSIKDVSIAEEDFLNAKERILKERSEKGKKSANPPAKSSPPPATPSPAASTIPAVSGSKPLKYQTITTSNGPLTIAWADADGNGMINAATEADSVTIIIGGKKITATREFVRALDKNGNGQIEDKEIAAIVSNDINKYAAVLGMKFEDALETYATSTAFSQTYVHELESAKSHIIKTLKDKGLEQGVKDITEAGSPLQAAALSYIKNKDNQEPQKVAEFLLRHFEAKRTGRPECYGLKEDDIAAMAEINLKDLRNLREAAVLDALKGLAVGEKKDGEGMGGITPDPEARSEALRKLEAKLQSKKDPTAEDLRGLAKDDATALKMLANYYFEKKDYAKALHYAEKLQTGNENDSIFNQLYAHFLTNKSYEIAYTMAKKITDAGGKTARIAEATYSCIMDTNDQGLAEKAQTWIEPLPDSSSPQIVGANFPTVKDLKDFIKGKIMEDVEIRNLERKAIREEKNSSGGAEDKLTEESIATLKKLDEIIKKPGIDTIKKACAYRLAARILKCQAKEETDQKKTESLYKGAQNAMANSDRLLTQSGRQNDPVIKLWIEGANEWMYLTALEVYDSKFMKDTDKSHKFGKDLAAYIRNAAATNKKQLPKEADKYNQKHIKVSTFGEAKKEAFGMGEKPKEISPTEGLESAPPPEKLTTATGATKPISGAPESPNPEKKPSDPDVPIYK